MATCRECLHYEVCAEWAEDMFGKDSEFPYEEETGERLCEHYTPKSDYVKRERGEWISVKDRLPPYNHDVLVYRPNMAMKIMVDSYDGYYGEDDNEWYEGWRKYGKDIHNNPIITHWAYLPQPPKGE